nr:hypothetical protein [Phycisphaerales bacterium]
DPISGRWLQRDPAGFVDGMNLYEYCRSRGLSGSDPLGLTFWEGVVDALVGLVKGAVDTPVSNPFYIYVQAYEYIEDPQGKFNNDVNKVKGLVTFTYDTGQQLGHWFAGSDNEGFALTEDEQWTDGGKGVVGLVAIVAAEGTARYVRASSKVRSTAASVEGDAAIGGAAAGKPASLPKVSEKVGQKQLRHMKGRPEWIERGGGSYFESAADAQAVLDAYHSGSAKVIGVTKQGHILVEYEAVTGFNNNVASGFINQPTHRFMIKGTTSPSVVPTSPTATCPLK